MNTPILFIVFNRPDTTQKVFDVLKHIKPKQLFISADGPRETIGEEKYKCKKVREIVSKIDWDCDVKTLFREKNIGCKLAVSSAIDWFFENVEQGIILEDDCLPDLSFFSFCEQMLIKYKDDTRIMHISGNNFQFGIQRGEADYYFSKLNHIWGWATWRRAWKHYDINMKNLDEFIKQNYIKDIFNNKNIQQRWIQTFLKTKFNKINTWDYQWTYSMWEQNGLAILPNKNLVENIGFNQDATHTKNENDIIKNNKANSLILKRHPNITIRDFAADLYYYYIMDISILNRIYNKFKRIIK